VRSQRQLTRVRILLQDTLGRAYTPPTMRTRIQAAARLFALRCAGKVKVKTHAVREFLASHICPQRTRAYMGHGSFFSVRRENSQTNMWATRPALLEEYGERFLEDFGASMPIPDRPTA